jgi:hypothetical protein
VRASTLGALLIVACGARTELRGGVAPEDASQPGDAGQDTTPDAPSDPCGPLEYANDSSSSVAMAIDDAFIYFVIDPGLVAMAKDGTSSFSISLGPEPFDGDIVVDDTYVYWTSLASVRRTPKNGLGPVDDLGCAALKGCPGNVRVEVAAKAALILVDGVQPVAFPKQGGSPLALASLSIAPPAPVHYVFADADRVYWNTDIRVFSTLFDGGTPQPIQYATSSSGLAIDSLHVYWTAISGPSDGGITRVPTSGGTSTVIVPNVQPLTLLLDGMCVYSGEHTDNGRRIARWSN